MFAEGDTGYKDPGVFILCGGEEMTLKRKVFVLGLDGASPDVINSLIDNGRLPSFKLLKDGGVFGKLRTTIPPITGSAWSSFMTGKNPGKHGIFDFTYRKEGKYELSPINARMREGEAFWSIATEAERKVCIFNVPVTYPLIRERNNGFRNADAFP